jgi:hypothetical protein
MAIGNSSSYPPIELWAPFACHRSERLVEFEQVDVAQLKPGPREPFSRSDLIGRLR